MEKQRLLYQQSRLHNRGAAEMVLQMISACKGLRPAPNPRPRPVNTPATPSPVHPLLAGPTCPLCMPLAYRHTPAPAESLACLPFESPLPLHFLVIHRSCLCPYFIPFLHVPMVGFFGGWKPQAERTIYFIDLFLRPCLCDLQERRVPWCLPP